MSELSGSFEYFNRAIISITEKDKNPILRHGLKDLWSNKTTTKQNRHKNEARNFTGKFKYRGGLARHESQEGQRRGEDS